MVEVNYDNCSSFSIYLVLSLMWSTFQGTKILTTHREINRLHESLPSFADKVEEIESQLTSRLTEEEMRVKKLVLHNHYGVALNCSMRPLYFTSFFCTPVLNVLPSLPSMLGLVLPLPSMLGLVSSLPSMLGLVLVPFQESAVRFYLRRLDIWFNFWGRSTVKLEKTDRLWVAIMTFQSSFASFRL